MGGTISTTKVMFMCGLWSVGVVALLSAGPFSYFCIHQRLFPCLEMLVQSASPHHAVSCKVLPGLGVDVKCFHVSLADILVAQLWAAFGSASRCKLSIEVVFWDVASLHVVDMPQPTQPALSEQGADQFSCKTQEAGTAQSVVCWACYPALRNVLSSILLCLFCLLVAYNPSNMRVYLRDGSAQTILRAATLR